MGRLENLQPILQPGRFQPQANSKIYVTDEGMATNPLSPALLQFLELCKGTYSIKEICLFIYGKQKVFSYTELYQALEDGAHNGLFRNSQQILEGLKAGGESPKAFQTQKALSKEDLQVHLRKVSLFGNLPPETYKSIIEASEQKIYKAGELIIKRDTVGEDAFVLLSGSVGVYSAFYMLGKGSPIAVLPPLSVFGESAAISDKKRTADVVALVDSSVLRMPLKKIVEPKTGENLNKNLKLRLVFQQIMKLHPVFRSLPSDVLQMFIQNCQVHALEPHKTVVQQGDDGSNFYFILSGNVLVIKDGLPEVRLGVGSFFGEMGILHRQSRSATIVTENECVLLTLSEKNFVSLLSSNFQLALQIEREISSRTQAIAPDEIEAVDPEITEEITQRLSEFTEVDFSTLTDEGNA